ncbi:hypothetical protein AVEN_211157-1 [Araneus ventricosus]|uniref:Uncharacterized protein n=1 Tax=Araneus ventricosus TaxID=182803 RepID=A0A4Y2WQ29_ARAVE|nr:hypothetical protein AVEN_211157-1 [Araneus ventricosus]
MLFAKRFIPKFVWELQQVPGKLSGCSSCRTRLFIRHFSQKSKYKPVKLAYELFEPRCGSDDRLSPLIFLHGITSSKEVTWGDLPQTFADQTKRKRYREDSSTFEIPYFVAKVAKFVANVRDPDGATVRHLILTPVKLSSQP